MNHQHQQTSIKAIDTEYAGHLFRSRLEARWAVFFDYLISKTRLPASPPKFTWEYEPEGFELPGGQRYLPDFRLHNRLGGSRWIEVKPKHLKKDSKFDLFRKAIRNSKFCLPPPMLVSGTPLEWIKDSNYFCPRCGVPIGGAQLQAFPWIGVRPDGSRDNECDWGFLCEGCDYETEFGISACEIGVSCQEVWGHKGWVKINEINLTKWIYLISRAAEFAQKARFEHGAEIKIPL